MNNRDCSFEYSKAVIESHSKKMLQQEQTRSNIIKVDRDEGGTNYNDEGIKFLLGSQYYC